MGWRWIMHPAPIPDPQFVLLSFLPVDAREVSAARVPPFEPTPVVDGNTSAGDVSDSFEFTDAVVDPLEDPEYAELLCSRVRHVFIYQRSYTKFYCQVFSGDGDLRWEVSNPDRVQRCRRMRLQLSEVLAAAGASTPAPSASIRSAPPPLSMSRTTSLSMEPDAAAGGSAASTPGTETMEHVVVCPSIICGPRGASRGPLKLDHDGLPFALEMKDVPHGGPHSSKYVPCNAQSWAGMQLEWCGPYSTLDECILACQAYYETGGREGAEKITMRRDMLDLLL